MIADRVNIESTLVRMLDLPHDLPSHVVVRLPRRRLNFAVDPESHCSPLPLPFRRMRLRARGTLAYAIRDRPDFTVFSTKVKQRFPFANHNILNISDEDSVVSCILCCIQSAFEISQRAMQHWSSQRSAINFRASFLFLTLVDTSRTTIVFRNRTLILRQNIYSEPLLRV